MNQAQLLFDTLYYPDIVDAQPWLIYYITRPLVGSYEPLPIVRASLHTVSQLAPESSPAKAASSSDATAAPRKKDVKSFGDLLNHFPMIARQMHPGLERLFKEFAAELEKPLPPPPSSTDEPTLRRTPSVSSGETLAASLHSSLSNTSIGNRSTVILKDDEDILRRNLETAVTAAIDLFQLVDKQQLSHLGATTDLTGPVVERMIERYVTEQVHDNLLFPRVCSSRRMEDAELESRIRQMSDVDISQVGIAIQGSAERRELSMRLAKGVTLFKKMGVASSPQETLEVLLATQKLLSMPEPVHPSYVQSSNAQPGAPDPEKQNTMLTINADTLVSLLLVVVIRSSVRHLNARLSYMRHFAFIDDVESGEIGYALSTFEAVLSYLSRDSGALRRASKLNHRLWNAARTGDMSELRAILESPTDTSALDDEEGPSSSASHAENTRCIEGIERLQETPFAHEEDVNESMETPLKFETPDGSLAHVFPFDRPESPAFSGPPTRRKKRVSVASQSTSSSSAFSFHSRTDSLHSRIASIDGDVPVDVLADTHNAAGESLRMMAVEHYQAKALEFLLYRDSSAPLSNVMEDSNNDGATLLSAAVQTGRYEVANVLLDYVLRRSDRETDQELLKAYVARQDSKGRSVAHYLFNLPRLISRFGQLLPWTQKDKNGQTPLFALCRSYDHEDYKYMVQTALWEATRAQRNRHPLHLDEHVDNKGNTLLHIVNDPDMVVHLLASCDSNVNASNDKHFTPLMVASKYGRTDVVRLLFGDPRVDHFAKDLRGLTAVELAKDDEVRNRIDDLFLLSTPPSVDGRISAVVRSFFVEDGTVRLILKSGSPNNNSTITVTTSRRTPLDFESLYRWLQLELPASWLPSINNLQSPFLIPSKPSRAILRDIQLKLDNFLRILLGHPTFSTHELVWEFFLVPDMDPGMLTERSKKKAETRAEMVRDEYDPISDVREVELFVGHAKDSVRGVYASTRNVLRRVNKVRHSQVDLYDALTLCSKGIDTLTDLPKKHMTAFERYTKTLGQTEFSPLTEFFYNMSAIHMSTTAVLAALNRPSTLIASMAATQKSIDRHMQSLRRSDRWPLGLLDETRHRLQRDAAGKAEKSLSELQSLGRELRYTQQTVAGELASYQDEKAKVGRRACKELARRMVVLERDRLASMRRAIRNLGLFEKTKQTSSKSPMSNGNLDGNAALGVSTLASEVQAGAEGQAAV